MANDLRAMLAQLIAGLQPSTPATRRAVYDRAREMLKAEVRAAAPFMPVQAALDKTRELEAAIAAIEAEAARQERPAPAPPEEPAPSASRHNTARHRESGDQAATSEPQAALDSRSHGPSAPTEPDAAPAPPPAAALAESRPVEQEAASEQAALAPELSTAVGAPLSAGLQQVPAPIMVKLEPPEPPEAQEHRQLEEDEGRPHAQAVLDSSSGLARGPRADERRTSAESESAAEHIDDVQPLTAGPSRALVTYLVVAAIAVGIAVIAAAFVGSLFDRFGFSATKSAPPVAATPRSGTVTPLSVGNPSAELIKGAGFSAAAEQALREGNLLLARGDYDGAIAAFDDAIRLEPQQPATYGNRAFAYWKKNNVAAAIRDYGEAIRLDPSNLANRLNRAVAHSRTGEYQLAVADLDHVIAAGPPNVDALNSRCWARALLVHLQEALIDCNAAVRLRPDDPNVLDTRGFVYLRLGRLDRAIADYSAALKYDPRLASALYGRGLARIGRGDRAGGNEDVTAARAIDPEIQATFARYGVR